LFLVDQFRELDLISSINQDKRTCLEWKSIRRLVTKSSESKPLSLYVTKQVQPELQSAFWIGYERGKVNILAELRAANHNELRMSQGLEPIRLILTPA
jgi:hypothetical protein